MTVTAYADASHCPQTKLAVAGYMLRTGDKTLQHSMVMVSDVPTSGDSEMYAAIVGMQQAFMVKGVKKIILLSDYFLIGRARHFKLTKKGKHDHPFFKEFKETIFMIEEEGIELDIQSIRRNSNPHSADVDVACRKQLRQLVNTKKTITYAIQSQIKDSNGAN